MTLPRNRTLLLSMVGLAALGLALPAIGQEAPESLLPPGFAPAPVQRAAAPSAPAPAEAAAPEVVAAAEGVSEDAAAPTTARQAAPRSFAAVGPLVPANGGLPATAWGRTHGLTLVTLMRRLDVPVASRWAQIGLRRALLSRAPAPKGVSAADWVAARAGLLLRLGEADAARMLIEGVDPSRYNGGLLRVAQQVALATADPAGLCPLTARAQGLSKDKSWDYARAICAGFAGDGSVSAMYLDRARGREERGFDHLLAEKLIGASGQARRAAKPDWAGVDVLTPWRFGLSAAAGLDIPADLLAAAPARYQGWRARAPMLAPEVRLGSAQVAATLGTLSSANLVDLLGQIYERPGGGERDAPAVLLRAAYHDTDPVARMAAIRGLWTAAENQPGGLYAGQILTARATARIAPDTRFAADYARLIGAMLAAGLDVQAARWAPLVEASSGSLGDEAWALLAVGAPRRVVDLSAGRIESYGARLGPGRGLKVKMLIAALGGLGRIGQNDFIRLARDHELRIDERNAWVRLISEAATRGDAASVALLVATGMQTPDWRNMPPEHLYHIVAALRRIGQAPAARMIAAEALTRL